MVFAKLKSLLNPTLIFIGSSFSKFIKRPSIAAYNYIRTRIQIINSKLKAFFSTLNFYKRPQFFLILLAICATALVIIYFFDIKLGKLTDELGEKDKPFYIRNIALLLAALGTAIFTWWKNTLSQKTVDISESIRQDELFAKAVDLLKKDNDLITRKAGVHILKDLAMTSPKHAQKCIDMLSSLNATWMPKVLTEFPDFFHLNRTFGYISNTANLIVKMPKDQNDFRAYASNHPVTALLMNDIALSQLVIISLQEIIKHIITNTMYKSGYSLSNTFLCSISLPSFNKKKFGNNFSSINLSGAFLPFSNFSHCFISGADLSYSVLFKADLSQAIIKDANLNKTDFFNTILDKVIFTDAKNLNTAIFNGNFPSESGYPPDYEIPEE